MSGSIDFGGIKKAALCNGRPLLQKLIPGGKFRSLEYVALKPRRNDKTLGSFKINYRSGVWKDFATGDGGGDLISLVAYLRGVDQATAAGELADILGVPFLKSNGHTEPNNLNGRSHNVAAAANEAPKVHQWGEEGPPRQGNEIRRHYYPKDDSPKVKVKIKIKRKGGPKDTWVTWYRVFSRGIPIGWQAKRPDDYVAVPYVTAALDPFDPELKDDELYWPEGERDVDSLNGLNLPAFTFGGVGDGLPDGIGHHLKDRRLVILADNDDPGREHAEEKAAIAQAANAVSIKIIHFPELPAKEDVSDFIAGGGTGEQLRARIDATPPWSPVAESLQERAFAPKGEAVGASLLIRRASDIEAQPITWLWPNRIAVGKLTLFAGDPGLGKSQLTAPLAAVVTTRGQWPCDEGRAAQGSVIIFSAEDDAADTIVPRLLAAGADLSRVHIVEAVAIDDGKGKTSRRMFHLEVDLARLEAELVRVGDVRLVIIDPITAYLGGVDTHRNSDVRGVLGMVAEMAARHRVAVVAVSHWNKSGAGPAVNRVTGSGAFTAAVRAAFMIAKDPDNLERRLFVPMKNNLARIDGGLAFRIEQHTVGEANAILASAIVWDGEQVMRTADEILAAADNAGTNQSARDDAAGWLRELLADGSLPAKQVQSEADAAGHSWATVKRAKKAAGIVAFREGGAADKGRWFWRLPDTESLRGSSNGYLAQERNVSILAEVEPLKSSEVDTTNAAAPDDGTVRQSPMASGVS